MNLKILPLSDVEQFFKQKCLIPLEFYPLGIKPGSIAKCITSSGQINLCRVFPSVHQHCCFLDDCVQMKNSLRKPSYINMLKKLEFLKCSSQPAKSAKLLFQINSYLLETCSQFESIDFLISNARHLLQPFTFVSRYTISTDDLLSFGITAITVIFDDEDVCYSICNETILYLLDVQIRNVSETFSTFYSHGVYSAQIELETLIKNINLYGERCRLESCSNAIITGPIGCGKSTLCNAFIASKNLNCFVIRPSTFFAQYPGEAEETLRKIFFNALQFVSSYKPKQLTVILIEDIHLICSGNKNINENSARISAQLITLMDEIHSSIEHSKKIMILATTSEGNKIQTVMRQTGRFTNEVQIAALSETARLKFLQSFYADSFLSTTCQFADDILTEISKQTQGFVVADIAILIRKIEQAFMRNENSDLHEILKNALKTTLSTSLRDANISVFKPQITFDCVGGVGPLKHVLEVSVIGAFREPKAFARFGLTLPKGILLYGPPGCAKTTIAQCLATEANMTFITTSSAEVYSPFVGCAEKFISKIFDTARKNSPCLIFLDEIDSLVGKRTVDSKSDFQTGILSTLLTEMDGIIDVSNHILVVAATNRPDMVDQALMRPGRFDKLIHIPAPDKASRLEILSINSKRMPFASDISLEQLALNTENFSGADLCNLCNEAALAALNTDFNAMSITLSNFEKVLSWQKSSLTKSQIKWYSDFEMNFSEKF